VLAKKDQIFSKKTIRSESEWAHMFAAWEAGVLLLYPHRHVELQKYHLHVINLFQATPQTSSVAIHFDIEACHCYAQSPYHLDDKYMLQVPLLVQLFRGLASSHKHDSDLTSASPSKRAMIPCQNWSFGFCDDPCTNHREHGVCSECGGQHKAKDNDGCLIKLQDRRRGAGTGVPAGGGSGGRA